MMRPLRIGVVGCGPIAQAGHFPAIVKAHNAQLYAIADHSARLRAYAAAVHQPDDCRGLIANNAGGLLWDFPRGGVLMCRT